MQKYDIYDAPIPFDDKDMKKERPVLVVSETNDTVIALKISSEQKTSGLQYRIVDWQGAGLKAPSYIYYEPSYRLKKKDLTIYRGQLQFVDIFKFETTCANK